MTNLSPTAFTTFAPEALPGTLPALEAAVAAYPDLHDAQVLAHWLGQMHVESAGFKTMVENLNYSVDALISMFSRARISIADAQQFGYTFKMVGGRKIITRPANQSAIANLIYGGAWGKANLGNTQPGDGWKFRGSGFKQLTGRANITASGFSPEELRTDVNKSALAAAQFFVTHGCVAPARAGDVEEVTRRVNGGSNGLANRRLRTADARKVVVSA